MIGTLAGLLLIAGVYAGLLGFGRIQSPARWQRRDEALWIAYFSLFFGALLLLDSVGITPHQISGWLQDILTSGGGAGTG